MSEEKCKEVNLFKYPSIEYLTESHENNDWTNDTTNWEITEKIDGSNFSFHITNNKLIFLCKGKTINDKQTIFNNSMESLLSLDIKKLNPNFIYHGESLCKLKHNVINYKRLAKYYFVLFDIQLKTTFKYLPYKEIEIEAKRMGFDYTPSLWINNSSTINPYLKCKEIIDQIEKGKLLSFLGGPVEGIVLKHPNYKGIKGVYSLKLKLVSKAFKEKHYKEPNVKITDDILLRDWVKIVSSSFDNSARYRKALQSCRDNNYIPSVNVIEKELDKDLFKEHINNIIKRLESIKMLIVRSSRSGLNDYLSSTEGKDYFNQLFHSIISFRNKS